LGVSRVDGIGGASAITGGRAPKAASGPGGFSVAAESPLADAVVQVRSAQPLGLIGMLALQEAETETTANKNGRRHGFAVLDALEELQHGLLSSADEGQEIARLLSLAREPASVVDPRLGEVLAAIRLRAKIELLRRGVEPG